MLHAFGTEDTVVLKVPLRNSENTKKVEEGEIHVLDPLSVISYLYNVIGIDIPEERVNAYWQHYRSAECGADWAKASPASDSHVPIGLYGDACRVRQGEKMTGIFMNLPLFRPQSIRCSRFLLAAVQEELMVGRRTLDCIWRYVIWCMNLLFDGRWPSTGIDGGPPLPHHLRHGGQRLCLAVGSV